jgi:hypothetical protein
VFSHCAARKELIVFAQVFNALVLLVRLFLGMAHPFTGVPGARACDRCRECIVEPIAPRQVQVRVYNQSRLDAAAVDGILEVANRVWAPYGVTVETATSSDAIVVIVAPGLKDTTNPNGTAVLGTTLFVDGHAMPNIHLWLGAAEMLAARARILDRPAGSRLTAAGDAILLRVMGVALAHELAHYLFDTERHSSEGLLRARLTLVEMDHADPARLSLTCAQRHAIGASR